MRSTSYLVALALLAAAPAAAQTATTVAPVTPAPATLADMAPERPGGLVLFTNTPWNDLGGKPPLATVEGVADGRLEVVTIAVVDPLTGATAVKRVVSNTPIPDSIESRLRFGGPESKAGRKATPRPGPVHGSTR